MGVKNKIVKHYRDFFDLHAKGIALTEDDHLNLDWAENLVEDLTNEKNSELLERYNEAIEVLEEVVSYLEEFKDKWKIGEGYLHHMAEQTISKAKP